MGDRIGIQRRIPAHEGQTVGKIEVAESRPGIVARKLYSFGVVSLKLKKPLRKVCSVTGAWPSPPKMIVR